MQIRFVVPGAPVAMPRQRHRIVDGPNGSFTTNYTPRNDPVNGYKASVRLIASQNFTAPIDGPVELLATFVLPRPKSMTRKTKPNPRARHTTKPDADNLTKALKDALKGIAWNDDAQVCIMHIEKWVARGGEGPSTIVTITAIPRELQTVLTGFEIEALCDEDD